MSRFLGAGAFHHDLDRQGRIPLARRAAASTPGMEDGKVKLVGVGEYLEVWDPAPPADRFAKLRREGVSARAKRLAGRVA